MPFKLISNKAHRDGRRLAQSPTGAWLKFSPLPPSSDGQLAYLFQLIPLRNAVGSSSTQFFFEISDENISNFVRRNPIVDRFRGFHIDFLRVATSLTPALVWISPKVTPTIFFFFCLFFQDVKDDSRYRRRRREPALARSPLKALSTLPPPPRRVESIFFTSKLDLILFSTTKYNNITWQKMNKRS